MGSLVPLDVSCHPPRARAALEPATLSVAETAELLLLSLGLTYQLVRDGTIPAVRLGRRWIIPHRRLLAWLNEQRGADGAPAARQR
ncbi:MAG TPA: helix-turn-helix domain-containing protein [Frankiaceae bacterium]|nr:helix-turn-helix domain-containing protein [Frankiaceae bacterium]